jgi:hypothetical protein
VKKTIDGFFEAARQRDWDAAGKVLSTDFHIWFDVDGALDRAAYVDLLKGDDPGFAEMVDRKAIPLSENCRACRRSRVHAG